MQINFLLYDRMTALDVVGPYEVLSRLPGASVLFVAAEPGPVRADTGSLALMADASLEDAPPADIVLVPGGYAPPLIDRRVLDWVRAADTRSTWTTSVCTGSLVLAAAGLLEGRRATTHWLAMDRLAPSGAVPTPSRVVIDGKYATAAGVSAGIDLALTLTERLAGAEFAQTVQLALEYDPQPPFAAGSPGTAPAAAVAFLEANRAMVMAG
ncbi:DJ-1/PfpI family protein [Actinoplanes sp. LDG1-06]|uniref:DJ-1/PfpI family protein n=1 Tax=Paractinoplanes ovalisporus TaxID=2810368 RepID=A0ABS2AHJ7_9ACTN|nr:DJ-1/PfpI family protein [Actinoplanes ovalisporus]MBM2619278.1 DJ-1/PfpI family protein [Actinoplanes ovalisporus]